MVLLDPSLVPIDAPGWSRWLDAFVLAVVRLNPSPAVQTVVAADLCVAMDLFKVSFLALWSHSDTHDVRDHLVTMFATILTSPTCPTSTVETIMSVIEYMDLNGRPIPLQLPLVAVAAERHQLYSKAIFFRELEYRESAALPSSDCVESLIAVNIKLGNTDSVHGLLRSSAANFVRVRPSWHEKLENWQAALSSYSVRLLEDPVNEEWLSGRMRCLASLGEWDRLLQVTTAPPTTTESIAFQAAASFNLQKWDRLETCAIALSSTKDFDVYVLRIASAIRKGDFEAARHGIANARQLLEPRPAFTGRSLPNQRADANVLKWEQLAQLEETIEYAQTISSQPEVAAQIRARWNQRLLDMEYRIEVWRRLVPMRALVLDPGTTDRDIWIRFSTLCRKKQNLTMSQRIVERLSVTSSEYHGVILAQIKNVYATGDVATAISQIEKFLLSDSVSSQCTPYLLSKCYHALGLWLPAGDPRIDKYIAKSVEWDPSSYKAWSSFALLRFRQAQEEGFGPHVTEAVSALFRCISLSAEGPLQDVLRLLTLWFSYCGESPELDAQFESGFAQVPLRTWIQALPQILARLRSRRPGMRAAIHRLVERVGKEYPQMTVFPLTVASNSNVESLASAAKGLLDALRVHSPVLVSECELIAGELVRISITWAEFWAATLEEASRLYFVEENIPAMIASLAAAHERLARGPETPQEIAFMREFGDDLTEAWKWVQQYRSTGEVFYLEQGWGMYYHSFQKIHIQVAAIKQLSLGRVSPRLAGLHDVTLLVPGSATTTIASFIPAIEVISSKQKPRIFQILGSNGRKFKYLLKGNEDLKQDERVMQLFGLINSIIADSVASRRRSGVFPTTPGIETLERVNLKRFAVVPLSSNAGLIEWVHGCDTLYAIIKGYREPRNIPLSIEHNLMRQVYTKYEDLPLLERVEIFRTALSQTSGDELRQSMWIRSGGADQWLVRRSMYARSLAVTSIVGFVLGLGDRHPSNLMIEESTGQVIHIDFGDCFDVASSRDRFPEKIPFRLTRQLVNALEVAGVEGTFRITAERMMDLIRKNSDTIMAMLEAFIYDPLITWRLVGSVGDPDTLSTHAKGVVDRVHAKLTGSQDSIAAHVDRLIRQATAHENLCQCYVGWCPFW